MHFQMGYQISEDLVADILTKVFRDVPKWQHAVNLVGMGVRTGAGDTPAPRGSKKAKKSKKLAKAADKMV